MILVTGGSGRIGSLLVEGLLKKGERVRVLDKREPGVKPTEFVEGSLSNIKTLHYALRGVDTVYHLAASIDYEASMGEMRRRNVEPTRRLVRMAQDWPIAQFIFVSSTSVYGVQKKGEKLTEKSECKPLNNYGRSKLECEQILKSSGLKYTILRPSTVYGPGFKEGFAAVLKAIQDEKMPVFGSGNNKIPMLHINDFISLLLLIKGDQRALYETFNIDSGYGATQKQFLEVSAEVLGVKKPEKHMNVWLTKLLCKFKGKKGRTMTRNINKLTLDRYVSVLKAVNVLGWAPEVELKEGIKGVVEEFRKEGILR